jgi:hypothetical protein
MLCKGLIRSSKISEKISEKIPLISKIQLMIQQAAPKMTRRKHRSPKLSVTMCHMPIRNF